MCFQSALIGWAKGIVQGFLSFLFDRELNGVGPGLQKGTEGVSTKRDFNFFQGSGNKRGVFFL